MKLAYPEWHGIIEWKEHSFCSLVLEHPKLLLDFLMDLKMQIEKLDGRAVLSENDVPIEISQHMELITDFVFFDLNKKSLITKIITALDKMAKGEVFYERTLAFLSSVENYVGDLCMEFDADIACEIPTVTAILKSVGLHIETESTSLAENIYTYMKLVREFDRDKLFVFLNLRSFLKQDELEQFMKTVVDHDFKVLLVDNYAYPLLKNEHRLLIDKDLCEI